MKPLREKIVAFEAKLPCWNDTDKPVSICYVEDVARAVEELKKRFEKNITVISKRDFLNALEEIFGEFSNSNHSPQTVQETDNLNTEGTPEGVHPPRERQREESSGTSNSQEICENCGHNKSFHHKKGERVCLGFNNPYNCGCKKFKQKKEKKK